MTSKLLSELNEGQLNAVKYTEGPLLVLAGAGSGKTRVLTNKIGYILEQNMARPYEILAVTFTNKAAREMKNRVENLIGMPADGMWIGTFHSICARILRIEAEHLGYDSNFTIYDVDDQTRLIQQLQNGLQIDIGKLKPRQIQYMISDSKNKMITPKKFEEQAVDFKQRKVAKLYAEYEKALKRNNAFDFDDLLIKPLDLFTKKKEILEKYQKRFRYVLVDEYQDTNKAQYYLIRQLSKSHRRICVVGDEDQSIYRWRGADIENILSFEKDYPDCEVVRLEQNYRSTQNILDAANAVVANNERRLGKNLWSQKESGSKISVVGSVDEYSEAAQVVEVINQEMYDNKLSYKDFAVLYRTNAQSRALEEKLRRAQVPYHIVGGTKFFDRKEVKDALAYLRVLVNPKDTVALRRIINYPTRGIGNVTQQKLEGFALQNNITYYQAMLVAEEVTGVGDAARKKIATFAAALESLKIKADDVNAFELATEVINHFGLKREYSLSNLPDDEARMENLNELLNSIAYFVENREAEEATLAKYLEEVALLTDIDRWDDNYSAVTLMTLHSAKGLEFPVVVVCGLEDGLFPLSRSLDNPEDLEEERRLFYVGMTRAEDSLYLLWARQRRRFTGKESGMSFRSNVSRFLLEIPLQYKNEEDNSSYSSGSGYSGSQNNNYGGYQRKSRQQKFKRPESTYVPDFSGESGYNIGDWVIHEQFGKGQILGIEKSTTGTKLTVIFSGKALKKLIAEYANLELVKSE